MTRHMEETAKTFTDALKSPKATQEELVEKLALASLRDYANTTDTLIGNYKLQIAQLEAELAVIRMRVNQLFSGDYMPTQDAITIAVFYPSSSAIKELVQTKLDSEKENS